MRVGHHLRFRSGGHHFKVRRADDMVKVRARRKESVLRGAKQFSTQQLRSPRPEIKHTRLPHEELAS